MNKLGSFLNEADEDEIEPKGLPLIVDNGESILRCSPSNAAGFVPDAFRDEGARLVERALQIDPQAGCLTVERARKIIELEERRIKDAARAKAKEAARKAKSIAKPKRKAK
jgi:hypothetical protein